MFVCVYIYIYIYIYQAYFVINKTRLWCLVFSSFSLVYERDAAILFEGRLKSVQSL